MQKIILFFIILLFAVFIEFFAATEAAFAQEVSPTPTPKVDYQLPYPGILPDSPLYFIKAARDRIVKFLISDPLKKGEYNLLQADKRLNSGVYLFKKGKSKYELTQSTISKGENYFGQALEKAREAKRQGKDAADLLRRLKESSRKHQEVLRTLRLSSELQRALAFEKEVDILLRK